MTGPVPSSVERHRGRNICVMGRILDQDDGLGVYADNLLRQLFVLDPDSHYHLILKTPRHQDRYEGFPNVTTSVIPRRIKILWDQVTVARFARRVEADIVFNPKFTLPLLSGRPGVFVLHGSDWYVNPRNYTWWDNLNIRIALPLYARKAERLLAISRTVVDDLVRFAGIDRRKVTVSYAAPSPHFREQPAPGEVLRFLERLRLPGEYMFAVARGYHTGHGRQPEYPGGNVEGLIAAYGDYRARGGNLPLVIAGDRILEYVLGRGFVEGDLDQVHFTGFVPHEDMHLLYRGARFFVLTTLYESFSLPLVEALACGCPVIAPSTGACPEVAGDAARLVDPRDHSAIGEAMMELDRSDAERAALAEAGRRRVLRYTWPSVAEKTLSVFDEICAAQPGARPSTA
jgi:glycosyltransferase involved in cell wall biosynthesis